MADKVGDPILEWKYRLDVWWQHPNGEICDYSGTLLDRVNISVKYQRSTCRAKTLDTLGTVDCITNVFNDERGFDQERTSWHRQLDTIEGFKFRIDHWKSTAYN